MANLARITFGAATNYADVTAPTLVSAEVQLDGTNFNIVFSEIVTIGAGGNGGFTVTASGGAVTLTYASGSGTDTLTYTLSRTITDTETFSDFDYTQPGSGVEDLAGNDLATFTNQHASITNSSGETGASYEFTEMFEGSNTDSQSVVGYDNTGWTSSNSANNPRYTTSPAPLAGTYSLRIANSTRSVTRDITGFGSTACVYVVMNISTWQADIDAIQILDSSSAFLASLQTRSTAGLRLRHGSATSTQVNSYAIATTYHVWLEYTKGTGANGAINGYVATTATKPGSPTFSITTGTATADADKIKLVAPGSIGLWDNLVCDSSAIGSDPV